MAESIDISHKYLTTLPAVNIFRFKSYVSSDCLQHAALLMRFITRLRGEFLKVPNLPRMVTARHAVHEWTRCISLLPRHTSRNCDCTFFHIKNHTWRVFRLRKSLKPKLPFEAARKKAPVDFLLSRV